jgi:bifunctional non-homologous end joining protein LigD
MVLQFEGRKLHGDWTLIRMQPREDRKENAWLLIKTGEDAPPISARSDDRSVLSGRTMKQIAAASGATTWPSDREQPAHRPRKRTVRPARRTTLRRRRS